MQHTSKYRLLIRLIVLAVILLQTVFTLAYPWMTSSPSIREVSESYSPLFLLDSFAPRIWLLIYPVFIVYGIIQVLPSRRDDTIYIRLSRPLVFLALLGCLWMGLYTGNNIGPALAVLCLMCLVSAVLFHKAHRAVIKEDHNLWLQLPFCLLCAWLCVMIPVNAEVYMKYLGWSPGIGEGTITISFALLLAVVAFCVSWKSGSLVFPAVIAFGLWALAQARNGDSTGISTVAFAAAIVLPIACVLAMPKNKLISIHRSGQGLIK